MQSRLLRWTAHELAQSSIAAAVARLLRGIESDRLLDLSTIADLMAVTERIDSPAWLLDSERGRLLYSCAHASSRFPLLDLLARSLMGTEVTVADVLSAAGVSPLRVAA